MISSVGSTLNSKSRQNELITRKLLISLLIFDAFVFVLNRLRE